MKTIQYSDPVFYDKKIQTLNEKLDVLGWIENIYPVCWKGESEEGTFPEVYYNSGVVNFRALPEGQSISFFTINGVMSEVDEYQFTVPFSLYVWGDLKKIYKKKSYDYTGELIKEVIGVLRKNSCNDLEIITDNVFSEFSYLEKSLQQVTMRPFTAFRINFTTLLTTC